MNMLDHASFYLCGQIESDPDCVPWRKKTASRIGEIIPTAQVWDPLVKAKWMSEEARDNAACLSKHKIFHPLRLYPGEQDRGWKGNADCRKVCQALVGNCNIVIARIINKFTWGSIDELEIAIRRNAPIFLWLPDGPLGLYGLPAVVDNPGLLSTYVHYSEETLFKTLAEIHEGKNNIMERDPIRWVFRNFPNAIRSQ
jgi:hypothetical protein